MNNEQKEEYVEYLKQASKELIDCIDGSTESGLETLKLIYYFTRSGFMEERAAKGGIA